MSIYYTATGFLHNHNLAYISEETSLYSKISLEGWFIYYFMTRKTPNFLLVLYKKIQLKDIEPTK